MKILSIGSDKTVFQKNSTVRRRIIEYGALVQEIHFVIFSKKSFKFKPENISPNIWLYPTNSLSRFFYLYDAFELSKKIFVPDDKWLITVRDPFEMGLIGYYLKKRFKLPLQIQIHTDFLSPYFKKESIFNCLRVIIAKFLIPRASCLRVVSERIKKSLSAKKITVLPIFVDVEKIKNTPIKTDLQRKYPQFDFIILMASRLTKEKNIKLAIKAMTEIVKKFPKTGLIIAGSGPEEQNLKSQISNLKINENVKIEPWIGDLISYYKTANLFLLTSNYEGYGRTIIEATATSCPVIMTDVGCAGEIVKDGENGLVVPVGDKSAIIQAIIKIRENPSLVQKFKQKNQELLQGMASKEDYLNRYKKILENCRNLNDCI